MFLHQILLESFPTGGENNGDSKKEEKKCLENLKFVRILDASPSNKHVAILCEFHDEPAVLVFEKTPFDEKIPEKLVKNFKNILKNVKNLFQNDVYGSYLINAAFDENETNDLLNRFFLKIIHPARPKDIEKFSSNKILLVRETFELYLKVTKPYIEKQISSGNLQWVYNVLDRKAEKDRVVYDNPDEGFMLVKDMKWKCEKNDLTDIEKQEIYIIALVFRRDLASLRDLNQSHLPLLESIYYGGREVIAKKYSISPRELRVFVHYQPTFYHLHVHFIHITAQPHERAHPLWNVIQNIQLVSDYYQKATLEFSLHCNSPLKPEQFD